MKKQKPRFKSENIYVDFFSSESKDVAHDAVGPILVMKLLFECMYGQHFQQSMDQPGMVANPVRGELNSENNFFSVPVRA